MGTNSIVIGIDLGTTNSCAAYYIDGQIHVLENSEGSRITPSFVYFTEQGGVIVGEHAKRLADIMPQNGVYEIKRLIGKKAGDANMKVSLKHWPFKVIFAEDGKPLIEFKTKSEKKKFTPVEITTYILGKIKKDIETKLNTEINKAVITVPAYFNTTQRKDTLKAAENAGFTVLKLLNEPTAAALIYFLRKKCNLNDYSLVYDLGGGTFDVAILKRSEDKIECVAVDGDTNLGGHDFDNTLIKYVSNHLINNFNYDPSNDRRTLRRLNKQCEETKKLLSTAEETALVLEGLIQGHNIIDIRLKQTDFENLNNSLFKKTIEIVHRCLKKAKLSKSNIKEIIMAGGSTRIPKIRSLLSEYFGKKKLNHFPHPDECVAEGAAIQAAMLSGNSRQRIDCIRITDVIPLSLGIIDFVDRMTFVIPKNTTIPISNSVSRQTVHDNQKSMSLDVYEGERLEGAKNFFLSSFNIEGLTPAPPGSCQVVFTLSIDSSGILMATAKEKHHDNVKSLKLTYTDGQRNDAEINSALVDAEENQDEDKKFKAFAEKKADFINYCINFSFNLKNKNLLDTYKKAQEKCEEARVLYKNAKINNKEDMMKTFEEIKLICQPIIKRHNFDMDF